MLGRRHIVSVTTIVDKKIEKVPEDATDHRHTLPGPTRVMRAHTITLRKTSKVVQQRLDHVSALGKELGVGQTLPFNDSVK